MLHQALELVPTNHLPTWVPITASRYLEHTHQGISIRSLARHAGCHASTVLRQIRKFENLRDDVLVDEVLRHLGHKFFRDETETKTEGQSQMMQAEKPDIEAPNIARLNVEGARVLRRMCELGAVLAVAADMEKAVVVRDTPNGGSTKTAVVERDIAQAMALKEWITCAAPGRISRYHITAAGRVALNQILADGENRAANAAQGFAEAQTPFGENELIGGASGDKTQNGSRKKKARYNLGESPLTLLARRKDKNGEPFLSDALVNAGERLREDFELAQIGPRVTQNWDKFLTGNTGAGFGGSRGEGSSAARERIESALKDLGPGLADVALRCCCFLEGLETAEKQMGWSARSGKIVLRISLQRLKRHYEMLGDSSVMIG